MTMVWCLKIDGGELYLERNENDVDETKDNDLSDFDLEVDLKSTTIDLHLPASQMDGTSS